MISAASSRSDHGSAILAVIWLILILSFAVLTAVRLLSFDMDVAESQINGFRAEQMAERGIAVGINPAVKRDDPLLQQNDADGASCQVSIESEGQRFNINHLLLITNDKRLVKEIFVHMGLDADAAQAVADALKDWVDPGDEKELNGAEKEYYEDLGRINQPFNRPFYSLDEMRLVRGMDLVEAAYPQWRSWFTVWTTGGLDINEADAEKIALAAECNLDDADAVVEQVRGADGIRGTEDDQPFQDTASVLSLLRVPDFLSAVVTPRLTTNDSTTRIESTGVVGASKRKITMIVRNRTGRPATLEKSEQVIP